MAICDQPNGSILQVESLEGSLICFSKANRARPVVSVVLSNQCFRPLLPDGQSWMWGKRS